jgi:tRNA A-37 threonylcarbamoyl transferase component Bud32
VILAPGARVGPYHIVSAIGRGGVGEVYLADDPRLRRQVALKILNARFADDETARGRFVREAQMAAALDHPNICTLHEIGTDAGFDYLVMQRLRGETLAHRMERGRIALQESLDIAAQLADALAYAHANGVVHRDIKPQNVMLTPEGRVKLMDFGLAKPSDRPDDQQETRASLTQNGEFFGTIAYMSPEQLDGRPADERSDIFSLGLTLYALFAGRHPFAGATPAATVAAIASRPAMRLAEAAPDSPAALTPILARALAIDPQQRYQTAGDLLRDLRAVHGRATAAGLGGTTAGTRRLPRAALMTAAAAAVAGIVAILPWILQAPASPPQRAVNPPPQAFKLTAWLAFEPSAPSGSQAIRKGSKFRVNVVPGAPGSLYIVSDERVVSQTTDELTLLYPLADADGAVRGPVTTDWYVIGGAPADTFVWVAWSRTPIPQLEALKPLATASARGVVADRGDADAVRQLLSEAAAHAASTVDSSTGRATAQSAGDVVVHRFSFRHR